MPARKRLVVLHLAGRYPLGGIGWQAIHYLLGLARLGHDVYYVEDSGAPPYDPRVKSVVEDSSYSVAFLADVMGRFGLADRWAYVDAVTGICHGLSRGAARGTSTGRPTASSTSAAPRSSRDEHLRCPVRVYVETDPVFEQIRVAEGDRRAIEALEEHTHHFTYGENLGQPDCPVPLEKFAWRTTRPPVVLDLWDATVNPAAERFTTVATWKNVGKDIRFRGETYYWSKHMNFLRVVDLPRRTRQPLELALEVDDAATRDLLARNGWLITERVRGLPRHRPPTSATSSARAASSRWRRTSYVRTRSGWFSDRSVCYLAAGKPVVTQDTGFGKFVPTGVGLLAFETMEEAAAALDEVNRDYARHCRAAREIALEYFAAERVLGRLCREADL